MSISYTPSTRSFLASGHVTTHSRKLPFKSANSPFAERWRIADRKHPLPIPLRRFFLAKWYFITKLGPQVSLSHVPFFGVNNFIFSHRGIEANPEKISAITNMNQEHPGGRWMTAPQ
jgi:hypothetical protein